MANFSDDRVYSSIGKFERIRFFIDKPELLPQAQGVSSLFLSNLIAVSPFLLT